MTLDQDKDKKRLKVDQSSYLKKLVYKFSMDDCKSMKVPMIGHFKLSVALSPNTEKEAKDMEKLPYA